MENKAKLVTNGDIMFFYNHKKEHYPNTDRFISECEFGQQIGGGYMDFARQTGHLIEKNSAEPNQKWHFLESYCLNKIKNEGIGWLEKPVNRWVFKCPELMLWLVEAAGIEPQRVSELCDALIKVCTTYEARQSEAMKLILEAVSWEEIASIILSKKSENENRVSAGHNE